MLYQFGKVVVWCVQKILHRVHVYGKENIPQGRTFLLCSNHISDLDPPVLGANLPFKIRYMGKAELFKNPLIGKLFRDLGAFPVKRGNGGSAAAVKTAIKLLKNGEIVTMFPEGGRSKDGRLRRGKPGACMIAHRANVGILPVGISGSYAFRHRLDIRIGEYIDPSEYLGENPTQEDFQKFTDEVLMQRIGELANAS